MNKAVITGLITLAVIIALAFLFKGLSQDSSQGYETEREYFIVLIESGLQEVYENADFGYDPSVVINVFRGLKNEDFNGVETGYGKYEIIEGGIAFRPNPDESFSESKTFISKEGMSQLLQNLSVRLGIEVTDQASVDEIIQAIR